MSHYCQQKRALRASINSLAILHHTLLIESRLASSPSNQLARRWLFIASTDATNSSTTSTSIVKKRKRRRPKSLSSLPSTPSTTRDRIRWLQDYNQVLNDGYYSQRRLTRQLDDFGQVANERINFVRSKLLSFWGDASPTTASTTSSSSSTTSTRRPPKSELKMDGKWWFWNLAFASIPAILIAAYCELIAKPEMMEYNRQMHMAAKREQDRYYNPEQDEELKQIMREAQQQLGTRLYNAVVELSSYLVEQIRVLVQQQQDTVPLSVPEGDAAQTHSVARQDSVSSAVTKKDVSATSDKDAEASIAELKQRLQELEQRLTKQQPQQKKDTSKTTNNSQQSPLVSPKSRIQARVMQKRREELSSNNIDDSSNSALADDQTAKDADDGTDKQPSVWWGRSLMSTISNPFTTRESVSPPSSPQTSSQEERPSSTLVVDPKAKETCKIQTDRATLTLPNNGVDTNKEATSSTASTTSAVPYTTNDHDTKAPETVSEDSRSWWSRLWPTSK